MNNVTVERNGSVIRVPEATVSDVISLMDAQYGKTRKELLEDLEVIQATNEEKIAALNKIREQRGMTSVLVRSAFTLSGATDIIRHTAKPEDHSAILDAEPDDLVWLALSILGFEQKEEGEVTEEPSEEERPTRNDRETSTKK